MADDGSVAPKERVNITYKPATGGEQAEVELPLKQLVLGDFTLREDSTPVDERKTIQIDKDNFNDVLKEQNLKLDLMVKDELGDVSQSGSDVQMRVQLSFENIRDFEPDSLVEQVPQLKQLILLRDALKALKGPLGNLPEFRRRLQELVKDEGTRERLLHELGATGATSTSPEQNDNGTGDQS